MKTHPTSSLGRFVFGSNKYIALLAAWLTAHATQIKSEAATLNWDGGGDGVSWSDPLNWDTDTLPSAADLAVFAVGGSYELNGNQPAQALSFFDSVTLGSFGNSSVLSIGGSTSVANISVDGGLLTTIHSQLLTTGATPGVYLSGGGTLNLTNIFSPINGNIIVDGSSLMIQSNSLAPHLAGTGTNLQNRGDALPLGGPNGVGSRIITLQNGGQFISYGAGYNPDGGSKVFNLGTGGGIINVAAGYQQFSLDDAAQISGTGNLTKAGNGRLTITSQAFGLTGNLQVNAGVIDLGATTAPALTNDWNRSSAFAQTASITVGVSTPSTDRPMFVFNSTTTTQIDNNIVLNPNGIIGINGADHILGASFGIHSPSSSTLTLNGGTLLSRSAFNPQTQQFLRVNALVQGSGTTDLIPGTNTGGNSRVVFQRGDLAHSFSGTYRLQQNMTLESHPRFSGVLTLGGAQAPSSYNSTAFSGNPFGSGATIELTGFNSGLDLRDNGGVATFSGASISAYNRNTVLTGYTGNTILVSSTEAGGVQRLSLAPALIPSATATATAGHIASFPAASTSSGNIYHFNKLQFTASQWLQVASSNNYGLRVNDLTLAAGSSTPWLDIAAGNVRVINPINSIGTSLTKRGNGELALQDTLTLDSLDIRHGTVRFQGVSGGAQATFAGNRITVNGGNNINSANFGVGNLILDNTTGFNADRISATTAVELKGTSTLRLDSLSGTNTTETIDILNVLSGNPTINAVRTGGAETSALTIGLNRGIGATSAINFTGTNLGGAATGVGQIFITGQAPTTPAAGTNAGMLGAWAYSGNDWAKYDANGVRPFVATDYDTTAILASGINANPTAAIILTGASTTQSLKLSQAGASTGIDTNGNLLRIESGGILTTTNSAQGIAGNAVTGSGLTAGAVVDTAANLYLNTVTDLRLNALVQDNGTGAVTVVKSGGGTLVLVPQTLTTLHQAASTGGVTALPGSYPAQPFTGGLVVNAGTINVWRNELLGTGPITLAGGGIELNHPVSGTNNNTNLILPGAGNDVFVTANSSFSWDNNGEVADGSAGNNNLNVFNKLTIRSGQELAFGGWNGNDTIFNGGAEFEPGAMLITLQRDANSNLILNGAVTGSAPLIAAANIGGGNPQGVSIANGGNASVVFGGGAADSVANTYSGTVTVNSGTLRANKANGTAAITGDILINGGTVAFGGTVALNRATFSGWGQVEYNPLTSSFDIPSGLNQIADTASVTMLSGAFGENNRVIIDTIKDYTQLGGTWNPGVQRLLSADGLSSTDNKFVVSGTATISGGNIAFNSGTHLEINKLVLNDGAPNLNIANNSTDLSNPTILEIGAGGLELNGHSINLSQGGTVNSTGARLMLGGNVTVKTSALNAGSYTHTIAVQTGSSFRELNDNNYVDLTAGNRTFNIAEQAYIIASARMVNGTLTKTGNGTLALQPYKNNELTALNVSGGVVTARGLNSIGNGASVVVADGGTLKLESNYLNNNNFTLSGQGAVIAGTSAIGGTGVKWDGALVSEYGQNTLTGAVAISGDTTISSYATNFASTAGVGISKSFLQINSTAGVTGTGTLTWSGDGDGAITRGVNVVGGFIKQGGGVLTLSAAGTYAGATSVRAGVLRVTNDAALGTVAGSTTVIGGAQLQIGNGITLAENLMLGGQGVFGQGGALLATDGVNALSGNITLSTATTVGVSRGATLNLTSATAIQPAAGIVNPSFTLGGVGTGSITAGVNLGTGSLTKTDAGMWTINGASSYSGSTNLAGGSLIANASAANVLGTGTLSFTGGRLASIGAGSITKSATAIGSGGAEVEAGSGTTIDLGTLTYGTGGSALYAGSGMIKGTASLTNGMLPSSAHGTDLATISGGNIIALPSGSYVSSLGEALAGGTQNVNAPVGLNVTGAGNSLTVNALRIENGIGIVASGGVSLAGSTIVSASSMNAGISGGNITSPSDMVIINSGNLDISARLQPTGGRLIKDGTGTLTLSADNSTTLTGDIYVNGGTLAFNGGVGTAHPVALGAGSGSRNIFLNGGTLSIPAGEWDPNAGTMQIRVGSNGGTIDVGRASLLLNDAGQFGGAGDLIKNGGGRLQFGQAGIGYTFAGNTTVNGGVLQIIHQDVIGNQPNATTITLNAGTAFINSNGTTGVVGSISQSALVMNNAQYFPGGGDRIFAGDVTLNGTNLITAREADSAAQNRNPMFNGRITQPSNGILNIAGTRNDSFVQLTGTNDLRGTINLGANAGLSMNGDSLSVAGAAATINLNGPNARFLLRNIQNAQTNVNVNVNSSFAEIFAGRIANNGSGNNQWLSVNDLSIGANAYLAVVGDNGYHFRVEGTTNVGANAVVVTPGGSANLWSTGEVKFASGAGIDRRGGGSTWIISNTADTAAATTLHGGLVVLRSDLNSAGSLVHGTLPNTSRVELRGGELRIENTNGANANRINDAAAVVFGGGTLRLSGTETVFGASTTAESGTTTVVYNPAQAISKPEPLTLPTWTRNTGATMAFASDAGTVGALIAGNSIGNTLTAQTQPRIILQGVASATGANILPWGWIGNEWLQNDTAAGDAANFGLVRGLYTAVSYTNNPAAPTSTQNANYNAATTLTSTTANSVRIVDGTSRTITLAAGGLTLTSGGVLTNSQNHVITGGGATGLTSGGSELFLNVLGNQLTVASAISGANAVVKSGGGTLILSGTNTFTGGTYINGGSTQWTSAGANGTGAINLAGGELSPNFTSNNAGATMNWNNNVVVNASSTLTADNGTGTAGVVQNHVFGGITFTGNYALTLSGWDGSTLRFNGGVNLGGFKPTFNLLGGRTGGTGNNIGQTNTLAGAITGGNGFRVFMTGTENAATARAGALVIGGGAGDVANTYTGNVQIFSGRVLLNKPDGVNAITADTDDATYDLELLAGNNGGVTVNNSPVTGAYVRLNENNQIADSANILVSGGRFDFNSKSETIKSLRMDGGHVLVGGTGTSTVNITGNVDLYGTGLFVGADGVNGNTNNGLEIGIGASVTIGGNLNVGQFGRMLVNPTNPGSTNVTVKGNIDLTGGNSILSNNVYQNGGGTIKLNSGSVATVFTMEGNLSTQPSAFSAMIDASNDTDNFVDLKGTRTFNIADGTAGDDFILNAIIRNNGANVGGIIKTGAGTMTLNNTQGTANSFTGPTTIEGGILDLARPAGTLVIPSTVVTVGNGIDPATLRLRNSNQIVDTSALTINAAGTLDLEFGNSSETVASVAGAGNIRVGPGSILTTGGGSSASFAGSITGNGGVTKVGVSTWTLSGVSEYSGATTVSAGTFEVNGTLRGTPVTVGTGAIVSGTGIISQDRSGVQPALTLTNGSTLAPGNSPGILSTGTVTTTGAANYNWELTGLTAGTDYDQLKVKGLIDLGTTSIFNLSNSVGVANSGVDRFWLIINDGIDPITGLFSNIAEGQLVTVGGDPNFYYTYQADAESNSITGGNDFAIIPEPSHVLLALMTGAGLFLRRRRASTQD
jgi:fibronectin-binding autotransporter adhesin